jgi:hypothetical protein
MYSVAHDSSTAISRSAAVPSRVCAISFYAVMKPSRTHTRGTIALHQ